MKSGHESDMSRTQNDDTATQWSRQEMGRRLTNMEKRVWAQCSDLTHPRPKQCSDEKRHSQRLKALSISHLRTINDVRRRNALDSQTQRRENREMKRTQQNRFDAAVMRHQQNVADGKARHGNEMDDLKTACEETTARHEFEMSRLTAKNEHKAEDVKHMALQFATLERKLKQNEARCETHQRIIAENARVREQARKHRQLLVAQSEVA